MQAAKAGMLGGRIDRANGAKRLKVDSGPGGQSGGGEGDAQFLPEDVGLGSANAEDDGDNDGPRLSKEVRELMARYVQLLHCFWRSDGEAALTYGQVRGGKAQDTSGVR